MSWHDGRPPRALGAVAALLLSATAAAAQTSNPDRTLPAATPQAAAATTMTTTSEPPRTPTMRNPPAGAGGPRSLGAAGLVASPPLEGLRGGGDAAPLCRARCAPAFYTCVSFAGADGGCHLALATCRQDCSALTPPPGRLQSPLPAAGLAPAGALRALPGGLPPPQ